jgi:hypothetical protein
MVNDDRVRVRASPDLSGGILGYLNRGDRVEILDIEQEVQKIDGEEASWYSVRTDNDVSGWMFGAYVDIR